MANYKPGQLVDYHRPTYDKDSHGGWTGPCVVVANEPEHGKLICRLGARDIQVQYPDARFSLFIALTFCFHVGIKYEAIDTMVDFISRLSAGKAPVTFGYTSDSKENKSLTIASIKHPKIFMAL